MQSDSEAYITFQGSTLRTSLDFKLSSVLK